MILRGAWCHLSDALIYVSDIVGSDAEAKKQMIEHFQWGDLHARCGSGEGTIWGEGVQDTDAPPAGHHIWNTVDEIEPAFWRGCEDFNGNEMVRMVRPGHYDRFKEIHVSTEDLQKIWPLGPAADGQSGRTKRQGAPQKHDWARIGAALGAFIYHRGSPTKDSDLIEWICKATGKSFDRDDLKDFLRTFRSEYDRLTGKK